MPHYGTIKSSRSLRGTEVGWKDKGVATVGLAINDGVMWLLVEKLALFYLAAKAIAAAAVFFWNFFIRQNYIHAPKKQVTNMESTLQ